jgi:hypothetical protein
MTPQTRSPTRSRLALLSLLCAAALGPGACGGDDDDGDAASQETTPTEATTTDTATDADAPTDQAGDPRAGVEQFLRQQLSAQGLSDAEVDCVVDDLRENVSDAQIADAITNARLSQEVIGAATEAAIRCSDAGG